MMMVTTMMVVKYHNFCKFRPPVENAQRIDNEHPCGNIRWDIWHIWKSKKSWNIKRQSEVWFRYLKASHLRSQCDVPEQLLAEALLKKVGIWTKHFKSGPPHLIWDRRAKLVIFLFKSVSSFPAYNCTAGIGLRATKTDHFHFQWFKDCNKLLNQTIFPLGFLKTKIKTTTMWWAVDTRETHFLSIPSRLA